MNDQTSTRLGLPLLQVGQAQKEVTHNEALTLLDLAVQAVVEAVGLDDPPTDPAESACWIVGAAPTGAWTGQARALAGWTGSGWRFVAARTGMRAWSVTDAATVRFDGSTWGIGMLAGTRLLLGGVELLGAPQPAIVAPANGPVIDSEARSAINAILSALRAHHLIAL